MRSRVLDLEVFGSFSGAAAINKRGQIVGTGFNGDQDHGLVWQDGLTFDLGTLPGGTQSSARSINDRGEIAGRSGAQAVIWITKKR